MEGVEVCHAVALHVEHLQLGAAIQRLQLCDVVVRGVELTQRWQCRQALKPRQPTARDPEHLQQAECSAQVAHGLEHAAAKVELEQARQLGAEVADGGRVGINDDAQASGRLQLLHAGKVPQVRVLVLSGQGHVLPLGALCRGSS